jgi:hypothetical protein
MLLLAVSVAQASCGPTGCAPTIAEGAPAGAATAPIPPIDRDRPAAAIATFALG